MKSRWISVLTLICAAALSTAQAPPAHATQINVTASECKGTPSEFFGHDALSLFVLPTVPNFGFAFCAIPRWVSSTASDIKFFIDGDNFNGQSTSCIILSWTASHDLKGSASFATALPTYDWALTLPSDSVDPLGSLTLTCNMAANKGNALRGITVYAATDGFMLEEAR